MLEVLFYLNWLFFVFYFGRLSRLEELDLFPICHQSRYLLHLLLLYEIVFVFCLQTQIKIDRKALFNSVTPLATTATRVLLRAFLDIEQHIITSFRIHNSKTTWSCMAEKIKTLQLLIGGKRVKAVPPSQLKIFFSLN